MKSFSIREKSTIAKIAAKKLGSKNVAIVIGSRIHLHGVSKEVFLSNKRWLRHELKHIEQFKRYGFFTFIIKYLWHSLFHGYNNCCYEKEARAAEDDESLIAKFKLLEGEAIV